MPNTVRAQIGTSGQTLILRTSAPVRAHTRATVQRVRVKAASGTYRLAWKGNLTAPLALGASPAAVRAALEALPGVGPGNVLVAGTPGLYKITSAGDLADARQPAVTVDASGLSGSAPARPSTPGTAAAASVEDGQSGWTSIGPWQGVGYGSGGGHHELDAQGLGDNSATWTFPPRAAGFYRLMTVWAWGAGGTPQNACAAATFRVYDGETYLGRYTADQSKDPRADDPATGLMGLAGVYTTGANPVSVVLDDAAAGRMAADVMTLVPADPAAAAEADDIGALVAGSWTQVGGYPTVARESAVTGESGQSAELNLAALAPASYALETTWAVSGTRSASVRYRVYDGPATAPALDVLVDQTRAPAGGTARGGHAFFPLGSAACRSGRLRVLVTAADSATRSIQVDNVVGTPTGPLGFAEAVEASVDLVGPGGPATLVVGGATVTAADPVWHAPVAPNDPDVLPYLVYPIPVTVAPGQAVTVSVPAGLLLTDTGSVDELVSAAAENLSGVPMFPALTSPRTMGVGQNIHTPTTITAVSYANLMKHGEDWTGAGYTLGPDGMPVFAGPGAAGCQIRSAYFNRADPKGFNCCGVGVYTVLFDSDQSGYGAGLVPNQGMTATLLSSDTGHATDNRLTYRIDRDTSVVPTPYAAGFSFQVRAAAAGRPVSNVRIYDPATDPANPGKFHRYYLRMLEGAKSIRLAFACGTNSSSITEWADYPDQGQRSYAAFDQRRVTFGLTRIGNYADPNGAFDSSTEVKMLVTCDRPHGLKTGVSVQFGPPQSGPEPGQIIVRAGANRAEISGYTLPIYYDPGSMGADQFAVSSQGYPVPGAVSPDYTYGGTLQVATNSIPPLDGLELMAEVGVTHAWLNLPPGASDDLVTRFAQLAAQTLPPGMKMVVELSNEHWNYAAGFSQYFYYRVLGRLEFGDAGTATQGYTVRAGHVHSVFEAALGARAVDLVRVFGTAAVVSALTDTICVTALARGIRVDAIAPAPYAGIFPSRDSALGPVLDTMTVGQVLDVLDCTIMGEMIRTRFLDSHRAVVAAHYPDPTTRPKLFAYEMAIGSAGMSLDATIYTKQIQASWQHRRFYDTETFYLDGVMRGGVELACHYALAFVFIDEVVPSAIYGAYQGWDMRRGRNDGTGPSGYDARPDLANVGGAPGPANMLLAESNLGAALHDWNGTVVAPVDPPPDPPPADPPPPGPAVTASPRRGPGRPEPRRMDLVPTGR